MPASLRTRIDEAAEALGRFIGDDRPTCALILGSGLNPFADSLENARAIPFSDVPHMGVSTAVGHRGRFVLGQVPGTGKTVLCMQGRLHAYEGWTAQEVALPVWAMHACGIGKLITTNAAGAINPAFKVGEFCLMDDMINFTGRNPLVGIEPDRIATRFVPMMNCFDPEMRQVALEVAEAEGVGLSRGVFVSLLGPSFETPAEIRALGILGADIVAMSVAEEVIAARHVGMPVIGISLVSNMACGVLGGDPTDEEVHEVAKTCEDAFSRLVAGIVSRL